MRDYAATDTARSILRRAWELHASVNQFYDGDRPYGFHLEMVADQVARYADELDIAPDDCGPVWFGACFHDSIEDARLTYNDVVRIAREYFPDDKALMASEIVYALTNEKGRTRAERANDRYYQGIRTTPYAPLVKMADRLANMTFSARHTSDQGRAMEKVYQRELPHFIDAITNRDDSSSSLHIPAGMLRAVCSLAGSAE